ncbi:MAG: NAD(P)-binding domain-containing protein [Oscillospiraceae bacterium]|nr:NAD(P)-binding domain-containing protein [Oscillospiraceae bacterium]
MGKSFAVLGGDARMVHLAHALAQKGNEVATWGLARQEAPQPQTLAQVVCAEHIILPLPLTKGDGLLHCIERTLPLWQLWESIAPGKKVFAGQVREEDRTAALEQGIVLQDYFEREELVVKNAAITAEGALIVAKERMSRSLFGARCLVVGHGRIGKFLAHRLRAVGAEVTVAVRRAADRAWVEAFGLCAARSDRLCDAARGMEVVFNTAPARVFSREVLSRMEGGSLLVDLASVQCADETAARAAGISYVWARGLPGRVAPQSAADVIAQTIENMLEEEEK